MLNEIELAGIVELVSKSRSALAASKELRGSAALEKALEAHAMACASYDLLSWAAQDSWDWESCAVDAQLEGHSPHQAQCAASEEIRLLAAHASINRARLQHLNKEVDAKIDFATTGYVLASARYHGI